MKKTISVNIKGLNFMIEEDAYQLLHLYLTRLEKNLSGQQGSKDIIEDIELRIAELCQQLLTDKKEVLEKDDIESIIRTLGEPEDFIDEDSNDKKSSSEQENSFNTNYYKEDFYGKEKKLYRDIENAKIAGICSGLANYLHVDVIIIRIIFLLFLLVGGFGFPLYLILWFVIPKANSTIDRLRMQGKPITVDSVKEEFEQAANRVKNSSKSFADKIRKDQDYTRRFSSIGRLIRSAFGIGLLGTGIFFLIIFIVLFFGGFRFIPIVSENGYLSVNQLGELLLSENNDVFLAWIGGFLVSFSVILFLISNGTYVLMNLKSRWTKISSLALFSFGVIGTVICVYLSMKTARDVFTEAEIEKEIATVNLPELIIERMNSISPLLGDYSISKSNEHHFETTMEVKGNKIYDSGIKFLYRESKDSLYHIIQNLSANSYSHENAIIKAKNIKHQIEIDSNILRINPEFNFPKKDKIRSQRVVIIIEIPVNKNIKIDNEIINMNQFIEEADNPWNEKGGFMRKSGKYENWD